MNSIEESAISVPTKDLLQFKIHPVTLAFKGALEKAFLDYYLVNSLRTVRFSLISGVVFYSLFGVLDAVLIPEIKEKLWLIRLVVIVPLLGIILFTYSQAFKRHFQLAVGGAMLVAGLGIIAMIVIIPPHVNHTYYAGIILVLIWGYTFTRIRFIWATLTGWSLVVLYETVEVVVLHSPFSDFVNNSFFFISSNFACMIACYFFELFNRKDFYMSYRLKKEQEKVRHINRGLEKIVARRTSQLKAKNEELSQEIEERKKSENMRADLESKLREAEKMEAIGTLAGGVAHDFNNLLMAILGNTAIMLMNLAPDHPHFEKLKKTEQCVVKGSQLTRQLLGFARRGKYQVKATRMDTLISDCVQLFGRTNKDVAIHLDLEKSPWIVSIDQGQIEQVLFNLFVNAWHAMPGGGELKIETRNILIDRDQVGGLEVKPGKYVKTSVIDKGIGMDQKTMQKIFDPFFTTKEKSRGTGMGLASAYGIVKSHGGFFDVQSQVGQGSTLSFYLPVTKETVAKEKTSEPDELLGGDETILLVDDEDIVTDVTSEMLRHLGYTVLSANNGKDAIDIYEKEQANVDLVILDMILPGMTGSKIYDSLKQINSQVKVLLSSGYSESGEASGLLAKTCGGFIQKPFKMAELSQKIREVVAK